MPPFLGHDAYVKVKFGDTPRAMNARLGSEAVALITAASKRLHDKPADETLSAMLAKAVSAWAEGQRLTVTSVSSADALGSVTYCSEAASQFAAAQAYARYAIEKAR